MINEVPCTLLVTPRIDLKNLPGSVSEVQNASDPDSELEAEYDIYSAPLVIWV